MINFNVIREQRATDAGAYRATINRAARYWLLESPLSNLRRCFLNVDQCLQFARKESPAGSMVVCDEDGAVDRKIEWPIPTQDELERTGPP